MSISSDLPPDLEAIALRTFDNLVAKGEILYELPKTSVVWAQGFQVLERRFMADTIVIQ